MLRQVIIFAVKVKGMQDGAELRHGTKVLLLPKMGEVMA